MADLLRSNKEENARIRVEYVIRLERTLQAFEGEPYALSPRDEPQVFSAPALESRVFIYRTPRAPVSYIHAPVWDSL